MRTKRMAALAAAGIGASLLVATPAGAGDGFSVTPTSGPVGTVITVSGTGCFDEGLPDRVVTIILAGNEAVADSAQVEPDDNGSWSTQLTVPDDADPAVTYEVVGDCWGEILGDNGQVILEYGPVEFDVTGDGPTPTTAPPATTPPTTGPGTPEVPTPPPATPVVRPPDQTG